MKKLLLATAAFLALSPIAAKADWTPTIEVIRVQPHKVHKCMSSEHFGQLAWQFKRMSGSSGLKVQAAIAC
jgi:hypothetical protein